MQVSFRGLRFRQNNFSRRDRICLSIFGKAVVQMTAEMVLLRWQQRVKEWACDERVRMGARVVSFFGAGFLLSAASLSNAPQPFAMALISCFTGWRALVMGLGSGLGYLFFWDAHGLQGVAWAVLGTLTALILGKRRLAAEVPLLIPAFSGLWASGTGLAFQVLLGDNTTVLIYLTRVFLAAATTYLFAQVMGRKEPMLIWLAQGIAVLALAQVSVTPWMNFGYLAAGALALAEAFPAAAMAGLALDLAGITPVSMTGVLCGVYLTRLIPGLPPGVRRVLPGGVYLLVMGLCGVGDFRPLLPLVLGGALSAVLPPRPEVTHRRGETGLAQVRLELMAGVLTQVQQLVMEVPSAPIDEGALLLKTRERACGSCPNRRACGKLGEIPGELLRKPLLDTSVLPFPCKKPGRMILELRRTQEQLRSLKADQVRRREYREAVVQQYRFLSDFLRQLSDQLPRRGEKLIQRYKPETGSATAGKEASNGDKLQCFYGTGCKYFVLLCDGMGTGLGASQEGLTASDMLRRMLTAGFPAEHALQSLNSLLTLRGRAGAVTVDLAEIRLDNGRGAVYKWGAAPSYLLREGGAEKIGTAGPPPGLDVSKTRETVERLSLRRGEMLILLSDGVAGEDAMGRLGIGPGEPPGEVAAKLLELGTQEPCDDATAVVIRLYPTALST